MSIFKVFLSFFNWFFQIGAPAIVPLYVLIIGFIFRMRSSRVIHSALTAGVGFTALYALVGIILQTLSPLTQAMSARYPALKFLTVLDLGWPVFSSVTFAVKFALAMILGLMLLNLLLVLLGLIKTLNVDAFNHWQFVFTTAVVYLGTKSWVFAIVSGLASWFITLKLADWTQPYIEPYYNMPDISIPHNPSVLWSPIGFLMDRVWDKIPKIRDITLSPEEMRRKFGLLGEPMVIGVIVGLILGLLAYIHYPVTGKQLADIFTLSLTFGFFIVLLPRCTELIVRGIAAIAEAVTDFATKGKLKRKFYLGLDVAVLVGASEHVALGLILIPFVYLIAALLPGNRILPLADAAGFMIFFTVFAVNTSKHNLFRGLLNSILIWIPLGLLFANKLIPSGMEVIKYSGFTLPAGTSAIVTCITLGANLFTWPFLEIFSFIVGKGTLGGFTAGVLFFAIYGLIWYVVRKRPMQYAEELKREADYR
jgi:PTS system galactitol-specific IIC component